MASSSTPRVKNTQKPTEWVMRRGRDYQGFRSKREKEWYEDWFFKRPVVAERAADVANIDDFAFLPTIQRRMGWIEFLKNNVGDCNLTICREFIASLIEKGTYDYVAYVRGKQVPFNLAHLSQFIQIPALQQYTIPIANRESIPPSDVMIQYLTGKPSEWDGLGNIKAQTLLPQFYKLWMIVCNCIAPTSHTNDLYLPDILLVHALAHDNEICLTRYLISIIAHPSMHTLHKESIKMGVLITKLCEDAGIQARTTDKINKQLGIVNNSTFRRSLGQFRARATEGGEGDEGDEENEPVAAPAPHQREQAPRVQQSRKRAAVEQGEGPSSNDLILAKLEEMQQMMVQMEQRSVERYEELSKREEDHYNDLNRRFDAWDARFQSWDAHFQPPPPPM
ncbi:hypothetical protein LguiA_014674 [Lonicera macranthoides]